MKVIKNCEWCGKEFEGKKGVQKFCSAKCRNANRRHLLCREEKTCVICYKVLPKGRSKYCSDECFKQIKTVPKFTPTEKKSTIAEINAKARAEGLSYGQYMTKYGY